MGSITATQTPGRGYVRLDVDWTSHPQSLSCSVWRVVGSTITPVRDGWPCLLSGSKAVLYDTEMPMDQPFSYRTSIPLNINGSFEHDDDWWNVISQNVINVERTTDFYVPGTGNASLRVNPLVNSLALTPFAQSERWPASAGVTYRITGWLMVDKPWDGGIGLSMNFYTSANAFISVQEDLSDVWPSPGEWKQYTFTVTAPATTGKATVGAKITGATAPGLAGVHLYVDEIYASIDGVTTVDSATLVFLSSGYGWWTDPLHPATQIRLICDLTDRSICRAEDLVMFMGLGDKTRPGDSTVLEVPDAERGVGVFATRKAPRDTTQVATMNPLAAERVRLLHASGAPILLQLPGKYAEFPRYRLYEDKATGRIAQDMTVPVRIHGMAGTDVGAPVGRPEGVLGTRYSDETKYATYAAATAAGATWTQWAQGSLSNLT